MSLLQSVSAIGPSIAEMIATTKRGLLVTRFNRVDPVKLESTMCRGYTRDGLWLIENGAISKAVKNFLFYEDVLAVLNRVDQLGAPQRVFHPTDFMNDYTVLPMPIIVPPLKIRDFNFTALSEAV